MKRLTGTSTMIALCTATALFGSCNSPQRSVATLASAATGESLVSSTPTLPRESSGVHSNPLDLTALAATRAQCLRSPLSPSASELPSLGHQRHEVRGAHGEVHVFFPPHTTPPPPNMYEELLPRLVTQYPNAHLTSFRSCSPPETGKPNRGPYCVVSEFPICEPWLETAEKMLPFIATYGLGLTVEIQGRPGPRCSGENCQPVPYHNPNNARTDLLWSGWFTLPRRANETRTPLLPELGRGQCLADGDCVVTGCGNHCEAWHETPHGATCPAYTALDDAYCGCVSHGCTWFGQAVHLTVAAQVQVTGWVAPTHPDARELESGDVVFRQLFEGPWFRRQLERAAQQEHSAPPTALTFELTLDAKFGVANARVTADGTKAPVWVHEIFEHLPVPVPTFHPKKRLPRVVASGQLQITSK